MFRIGPSPGGTGLGMIALRDIPDGIPVISEEPSIRLPRHVIDSPSAHGAALLLAALGALDDAGRATFSDLAGSSAHEKLTRNCCGLHPSVDEVGIFFSYARVNHSCNPNIISMVDADGMTLIAQRHITAGEELTISYVMPKEDILLGRNAKKNQSSGQANQIRIGALGLPMPCVYGDRR